MATFNMFAQIQITSNIHLSHEFIQWLEISSNLSKML